MVGMYSPPPAPIVERYELRCFLTDKSSSFISVTFDGSDFLVSFALSSSAKKLALLEANIII
eukprot:UN19672